MSQTKGTRRPLIAHRCLNSTQLGSLLNLVSIPVACGTKGLFVGSRAACWKLTERCFPHWGTPLLVMGCRHSSSCASVSKNIECWSLLETNAALCFVLSLPGYSPPALQAFSPPAPPPGSLGAPRTSGNPNRVWARNVAGCPMTGSWVSKTAFPKRNLGFLLKSFLLPSVFLFFHFCNWYHRSLSGSSPQHKSPSWFYFPSLPTSVSPITAPFKIYLQEIYFSSSPLSPFFATTSN